MGKDGSRNGPGGVNFFSATRVEGSSRLNSGAYVAVEGFDAGAG
jgi:hypothetical protein